VKCLEGKEGGVEDSNGQICKNKDKTKKNDGNDKDKNLRNYHTGD